VENYGTDRQATGDNIIRRMRVACWITTATDTRSEYVTLIAFLEAKMVTRNRLNVSLYVHCPSSLQGKKRRLMWLQTSMRLSVPLPVYYQVSAPQPVDRVY
jgi:hypothetical protein